MGTFLDDFRLSALDFKENVIDDDSGIGVVEVILILLVLVGLVLIFKEQIIKIARGIFSSITGEVNKV